MLKVLLSLLLSAAIIPVYDTQLQSIDSTALKISMEYKISLMSAAFILSKVNEQTNNSFPSRSDVLAIMCVESSFQHKIRNGLMQIVYTKTYGIEDNIAKGVWLLRDYKSRLGSNEAAIQAYNIGLGSYTSGIRNKSYYKRYLKCGKKF